MANVASKQQWWWCLEIVVEKPHGGDGQKEPPDSKVLIK